MNTRSVKRPSLLAPGVMLQVRNLDASLDFYTQTLGLPLGLRCPDYAEVDAPGLVIELHGNGPTMPTGKASPRTGTLSIGFRVDDLQTAVRYFETQGMQVQTDENDTHRWAQLNDPDGTPLRLIEHKCHGGK